MSCAAAITFSIGGIFMKLSLGLSQPFFSAMIFVCFAFGVIIQTLVIAKTELGSSYISILGLEAVITLLFSIGLFKEGISWMKVCGLVAILAGVILLRSDEI
jgi:multidrug transporter EmrE-like cation transporter